MLGRCKGKHYFFNLQIFDKLFFKESRHLSKLDHIYCLSVSGISSNHPMAVTIAAYRLLPAFVRPTHLAPEQGLEPRTP